MHIQFLHILLGGWGRGLPSPARHLSKIRRRAQSSPARRSGNYGLVTGAKPDGVVAVTLGVATLVSGTGGGVVVVTVCSVACGATAPTTCAGWAELTSPKITPSAPMATTALAPTTVDNNLTRFC
jgi:hypothetical protein